MTSFRQVFANRRNARKSTGPRTEEGKQHSRCNAVRHGLTAETVIGALEDAEDYKAFEAAVMADYDAQSAVERELVLRLASLLWRLRRATAMETGLFEIQAGHLFVGHFRIDADHVGMIESGNKAEVMACGGHINIAARLVGFGFEGEAITVAAIDVVFAEIIDGFAETFDGFIGATACIGFHTFATAPENENFRAQFRAEIHGAKRFLQGVGTDFRIVRSESAIAKDRVKEERNGGHGNNDAVVLAGFLEFANDFVAFGRSGVDGHEIVVMKIDAPSADFRKHSDDIDRRNHGTNEISKRIAAAVTDGPQAERKFMFGPGLIGIVDAHARLSLAGSVPDTDDPGRNGYVRELERLAKAKRGNREACQRATVYVNGKDIVSCVRRIATIN